MNEQTTKLIEQLAQKLGTTAEYLWSVLLNQAPIDATIQLVQTIMVLLFGFVLWRVHKRLSRTVNNGQYLEKSGYEKYDALAVIPMLFAGLLFGVLAIIYFSEFSNIINGYFNTEYWALDKVLTLTSK